LFGGKPDAIEVVRGLWIGSAPSGSQARRLCQMGVDAVVDLRAERPGELKWPPGVEVRYVPLIDHGTPSVEELRRAADEVRSLQRQGREVFVHCHAGLERGPVVACAALVIQGWALNDAYNRVVASRPRALPTEGQLTALRELAEEVERDKASGQD
jgi:protein-tyrosine phosphatase